ncbi:nucleotidyltransferase family protein [Williamsia sterculiae]|uniref:Nicotine blue oxidoreductase n=1 Tax=Williamsia sterculiae TaxID=1344003 RepID=A0A1N7DZ78_9NOCA|nr:NTP transferase domain-containing protein [Williamsia sterculiae]SIR81129.1 nicotine blue oxidoreductase [Williamsia sterculiae]
MTRGVRRGVTTPHPVVGVVLAAGAGTRYGMPKILAAEGDWLHSAVRALHDGGCERVLVTRGAATPPVPTDVEPVDVEDWATGLSASVAAGLRAARDGGPVAGVVLHVVDVPDTSAAVVARVLSVAAADPDALVRATFHRNPGHPVYIGARHIDAVTATLTGDRGAGRYLNASPATRDIECGDLATGVDHDRPVPGQSGA